MSSPHSSGISLSDIWGVVLRHRRLAVGFFLATLVVTTLALRLTPRTFRSEAKLFIRMGRETASLDATATIGRNPPASALPQERENAINSATQILQSRVLLEQVVDALGPATILADKDLPETNQADEPASPAVGGVVSMLRDLLGYAFKSSTPLGERDRAILQLQTMVYVTPVKHSDVVSVACESGGPKLSQRIAAQLIDAYLAEHLRLNRTSGAREFLERQTAEMQTRLSAAEEELRAMKDQAQLASPEIEAELMTARAGALEDELLAATSSLASTEAHVRQLREKLTSLPKTAVTAHTEGILNHGKQLMQHELYRLQLVEQELAARMTDEHTELKQARDRVVKAKTELDAAQGTSEQETTGPNAVYEQVQVELVKQEPLLNALRAKRDTLQSQLAEVRQQIKKLNADEVRFRQLQRDLKRHVANFIAYMEHLEHSQVDEALEADRITSINIIQPATLEPKPIKPKLLLGFVLGLMIGLCGAMGLPLAVEAFDRKSNDVREVEDWLDVPVLASIPRFNSKDFFSHGNGHRTAAKNGNGKI
jgi:polysaccharide biosynthesis protein PslE